MAKRLLPFLLLLAGLQPMEKCVPHSAVVRIPDARHGLFFDNPGGVNDALLNFLATAGRAPRK